jgi:hypothetical protein
LWLGKENQISPHLSHNRYALSNNAKVIRYGQPFWKRNANPSNNSVIPLPLSWRHLLLVNKTKEKNQYIIYVYSDTYFVTFSPTFLTKVFFLSLQTDTLFLSQRFYSWSYTHYLNSLKEMFRSLTSVRFVKMKFKGKGYYVYKNFRHTLAPQFGYYHKIYVYAFNVSVKFLSKTSVLLFGLSKNDLLTVGYDFRSKKPMNIFTGRGVRFSRQVVYKKTGKVSSYR